MFRQKACKKESDWAVTAFPEGNSKDGIIPLQAANNIHTERMKGAVNPGTRITHSHRHRERVHADIAGGPAARAGELVTQWQCVEVNYLPLVPVCRLYQVAHPIPL